MLKNAETRSLFVALFGVLAEIYFAKESEQQSQKYARLAYEDLLKDAWMKKLYPKRIQRLLELGKL